MALSDYYLCDICESKTFYDASLSWKDDRQNPRTGHPWPDGHIGEMAVICDECAEWYKIEITEKLTDPDEGAW